MARYPYNTTAWAKVRDRVLRRDGHECQLRLHCCTGHANTADHVIPVAHLPPHDPRLFAESNLQAACTPCNSAKRDRIAGAANARPRGRRWAARARAGTPTRLPGATPPGRTTSTRRRTIKVRREW